MEDKSQEISGEPYIDSFNDRIPSEIEIEVGGRDWEEIITTLGKWVLVWGGAYVALYLAVELTKSLSIVL